MLLHIKSPRDRAIAAFAATVVIAWLMRWEAGDLMWGIWASSATYGYVFGVVLIVKNPEEVDAGDGSEPLRLLGVLAFFTGMFGLFHYGQGIFLDMVFPITPLEGWALFLYPLTALSWYWGVIATTFYSRWPELVEATKPSDDVQRILQPAKNIVRMQVLIFVFMFLSAAGLIRFAVYPVLVFYFFPFPIFREKLMYLLDRWDDYLNAIPPDEFEEVDEFDED
ncbi:DUF6498-containing protein [Gemmatimonadota bacterium]